MNGKGTTSNNHRKVATDIGSAGTRKHHHHQQAAEKAPTTLFAKAREGETPPKHKAVF